MLGYMKQMNDILVTMEFIGRRTDRYILSQLCLRQVDDLFTLQPFTGPSLLFRSLKSQNPDSDNRPGHPKLSAFEASVFHDPVLTKSCQIL